jgi:hypothetical protein
VPIVGGGALIAMFSTFEKLLLQFTGRAEPMPLGMGGHGGEA